MVLHGDFNGILRELNGFNSHGGTPIAGWFISGKMPLNWMITGGYPYFNLFQESPMEPNKRCFFRGNCN